eukprot:m.120971 g.120971  ORF g.120971 m.120971 type:complete len:256 (-) comp15511_c0_seq1:534-1301(-)
MMAKQPGDTWWESPCPLTTVPRMQVCDPSLLETLRAQRPVVISGSQLVQSAMHWDIPYMQAHMGDAQFTVYESRGRVFMYSDDEKNIGGYEFASPTRKRAMTFRQFAEEMGSALETGDRNLYLQQGLNDTVGPRIVKDFIGFNWQWLSSVVKALNWGQLTTNMLFVSMPHLVTPCHYDEQENLFAQVKGYKRIILFHPEHYRNLYPYRYDHPCDRQSQVRGDHFCVAQSAEGLFTVPSLPPLLLIQAIVCPSFTR